MREVFYGVVLVKEVCFGDMLMIEVWFVDPNSLFLVSVDEFAPLSQYLESFRLVGGKDVI